MKRRLSAKLVADALIQAQGMVTHAATKLGCDRRTIYRYIDKYDSVREAIEVARESLGDSIEATLLSEALGRRGPDGVYVREPNTTALIFLAKTHPAMRKRGYAERKEITGADGKPIQQQIEHTADDDRIARIAELLDRARTRRDRTSSSDTE